ncbi:hypothetical protein K1719_022254 [Acacia pycnantha]|nr:hypothetical protein K1719_022254 [Acacia pycnantha]
MGGIEEEWKKRVDTHRVSPPGYSPMGLVNRRRVLSFGTGATVTAVGLLLTAAIGYSVLPIKKNPEASAKDVAKASVGVAGSE